MISHTYKPGKSICFVVTKPKPREIFAADFRDRIVHHVLVGYLEPIFESAFIDQSYACRKRKGAHRAISDLKKYVRRVTDGGKKEAWYLQVDVRSFFVSLDKKILYEMIKKKVNNPEILWLTETIIFHDPTLEYIKKGQASLFDIIPSHKSLFKVKGQKGLPIGNLTSQFFANVYLNALDQYVKHTLKARYYLRYVDDLVILSEDRQFLVNVRSFLESFLSEKLKLELHPTKQKISLVKNGIDFVGVVTKMSHSLVRRRVLGNLKSRLKQMNEQSNAEILSPEKQAVAAMSVINSYYGHFKYANTFSLRRKLWKEDFGGIRNLLEPVDTNISYFNLKDKFLPSPKNRKSSKEKQFPVYKISAF